MTGVNKISMAHIKIVKFPQKDIDKFKKRETNNSTKKFHLRRKKRKHGTDGTELKRQLQ